MPDPVGWPVDLPKIQAGLDVTPNSNIKTTPMGSGPAKVAQIDDVEFDTVSGTVVMTIEQLAVFRAFLRDDINFGATPFLYMNPTTLEETTFLLLSYGALTQVGPGKYQFPMTLQQVP